MRSIHKTLIAAIAVLALSAITASAASAHEFRIAGSPLTKEVEAKGTGGTAVVEWPSVGVKIECKNTTATDDLKTEGKSQGAVTLEGCKVAEITACSVANFTIDFNDILTTFKEALNDEILPREGNTLFYLEIKNSIGKFCSFRGDYPVTGKYHCALPGIGTEALEHETGCKTEGTRELEIQSNEALTLSYTGKLKLSTGQDWSAS